MRGAAARRDLEGDEALVRDADPLLGGLADDRGVGAQRARDRLGADRRDLLVGDGSQDDVAAQAVDPGHGEHRRREAALHVVGAAPVQAPALDQRLGRAPRAAEADRVGMSVQEQGRAAAAATRDRDHVRPPGRGVRELDLETRGAAPLGNEARQLALTRTSGDELRVDGVDRDELRQQLGRVYWSTPSSSSESCSSAASR